MCLASLIYSVVRWMFAQQPLMTVSYTHLDVYKRQVERYVYMVVDGVQRAFFEHNDKEATLVFSYAPSFSGIIDSFFTQTPSRFHLETITKSTLLRIHYNDMHLSLIHI